MEVLNLALKENKIKRKCPSDRENDMNKGRNMYSDIGSMEQSSCTGGQNSLHEGWEVRGRGGWANEMTQTVEGFEYASKNQKRF